MRRPAAVDVKDGTRDHPDRRPPFTVQVVSSVEVVDIDAWLDQYVRAIAAAQSSRTLAA